MVVNKDLLRSTTIAAEKAILTDERAMTNVEGIYAAVTRRTLDDRNPDGWVPEQKISVEEAVRAYTSGAAYASFEESAKGVLAAGKLADFVVLDRNIFEIPPEEIRNVRVMTTVVGGRKVFERGSQSQ